MPVDAQVVISQVYGGGGNTGAPRTHDFIELRNNGATTINLTGYSLQYASATGSGNFGGTSTQLTELSGCLAAGEYFLVREAAGAGNGSPLPTPDLIDSSPIAMSGTAGKVALVTGTSSLGCNTAANCSAAALARIIDLVGYGNANFFEGAGAAPTLSNSTAAIRAAGGLTDTNNNNADFTSGTPNPRNAASGAVCPPPPVPTLQIDEIQGNGAASSYAGQMVETLDNIVTAVAPTGFFIQMPDAFIDADPATSSGIFVFTSSTPTVAVGDQVDVKGNVVEFFGMTEFSGSLTITIDASSLPLPAYSTISSGFLDFEQFEGMLVRMENGAAADGTDNFGETMVVADATRPFRTPGITGGDHPEIFKVDPGAMGGLTPAVVGGASVALAEGPFAFDFGQYSIWATTFTYTNPTYPRGARLRNAGEFTVGAQNMLQLAEDEPNAVTYNARLARFSTVIREELGAPDILAVSEVDTLGALQDLADRVNLDQAGLNYAPYLLEGHDIGGIDVGFLVRDTVSVSSIAQLGADDMWDDPNEEDPQFLNDRPPLLLSGSYIGNGEPFDIAVIAVHQRSLIGVETARTQMKRQLQAENLAGYINALPSDTRLVVTGDFNAFEFDDGYVDVMGILTSNASLTNQVLSVDSLERYSYIHDGVAQVLDHSLTSVPLDPFVRGLTMVHANVDAPAVSAPPSDHDAVVLFVMSDFDGDDYADDVDECPTGDTRETVILGSCDSGAPNILFEGGCTLADRIGDLKASANNHGLFVTAVSKLTNKLVKDGQLNGEQKGQIEACAGQWN